MPISHVTKVFAIKEMKISKLTADAGGPTYAASVALPGAKTLTLTGTVDTKQLRGDNTLLDQDAIWTNMRATVSHAKINMDALAVLFSTTVVDSGTTPNQLATMGFKNTDSLNYFKIEARSLSADVVTGDVLYQLWKCKLAAPPSLGLAEEDYMIAGFDVVCAPRVVDSLWFSVVARETAAALT